MPEPASGETIASLTDELIQRLCNEARDVAQNSYAPYSRHRVGAAIFAAGRTFSGTNIENASFPAGVCAERMAVGAVVSAGHQDSMIAIAIYSESDAEEFSDSLPVPCGICLQWLAELAPDIDIIVCQANGALRFRVGDLLVRPFKQRT